MRAEDSDRSFEQWRRLDLTSLRLKCNFYRLVETGKKDVLIERLMDELENGDDTPPPSDDPDTSDLEYRDDEDFRNLLDVNKADDGEFSQSDDEHNRHDNEGGEPPGQHPNPHPNNDEAPDHPHPNNDESTEKIHDGDNQNGGDQLRDQNKENPDHDPITNHQQQQPPDMNLQLIHELRAMRSELKNIKSKQTSLQNQVNAKNDLKQQTTPNNRNNKRNSTQNLPKQPPQKRPRKQPNKTTQSTHRSHQGKHNPLTQQQIDDNHFHQQLQLALQQNNIANQPTPTTTSQPLTQLPQNVPQNNSQQPNPTAPNAATAHGQAQATVSGTSHTLPNPWDDFRNPFVPPSLNDTLLKKIEEGKFVDFTDPLPDNQAADIQLNSEGPAIHIDESTGILRHKDHKTRKLKVNTFHRWSTAWTIFAQAHLHFHPEDYFQLFMYHSHFVEHVNQYKYEACHRYDRDFRISISNQRKMDPKRRTCQWSEVNENLRIKYLSNSPLFKCDICKNPGHNAKQCKAKQNNTEDSFYYGSDAHNPSQTPQHTDNQQWRNNSNFRGSNNNRNQNNRPDGNSNSNNIPSHRKPCWRFNQNRHCNKPPCQFMHACERCGGNHGSFQCRSQTSTNFIPLQQT